MSLSDSQLRKQLPVNFGFTPMFRLRWRFIYSDGKPDRVGGWNGTSQNPVDMASFVDKKNLLMAVIEGEKVGAWTIKTLLEVDGHMYATAKWKTVLSAPMFAKQDFTSAGTIVGLEFQTNDSSVVVYVDGQIIQRELTPDEQKFKLTEHRNGVEQ